MEEQLREILETLRRIEAHVSGTVVAKPAPVESAPAEFGRDFMALLNADDLMGAIDARNRRIRQERRRKSA